MLDMAGLARLRGAFWCHFPPGLQYGAGGVRAHLLWHRVSGGSFIKVMNEFRHPGAGSIPQLGAEGSRAVLDHFRPQSEMVRRIVAATAGRVPVFPTVINPFGEMRAAFGDREATRLAMAQPVPVGSALCRMAEDLAVLAEHWIQNCGATGIFLASQGGERERFSAPLFNTIIGGPDRIILDRANRASPVNILHVCGEQVELDRYRGFHAAAVNWDAPHNVPARHLWPGAVLLPGLDTHAALAHGSAREISAELGALQAAHAGRPLLVAAACTVSYRLAPWRMRHALQGGARAASRADVADIAHWHGLRAWGALRSLARDVVHRLRRR